MNKKHCLFLLFLLLFTTAFLYSQITTADGYIITSNNDTLYGKLEYSNSPYADWCIFKWSLPMLLLQPHATI